MLSKLLACLYMRCTSDCSLSHNEDAAQNTETLGYENFDWGLFPGFQLPHHTKICRRAWIWTQMYEVEEIVTVIKYEVCNHCLKSRPTLKGNWAWNFCGSIK